MRSWGRPAGAGRRLDVGLDCGASASSVASQPAGSRLGRRAGDRPAASGRRLDVGLACGGKSVERRSACGEWSATRRRPGLRREERRAAVGLRGVVGDLTSACACGGEERRAGDRPAGSGRRLDVGLGCGGKSVERGVTPIDGWTRARRPSVSGDSGPRGSGALRRSSVGGAEIAALRGSRARADLGRRRREDNDRRSTSTGRTRGPDVRPGAHWPTGRPDPRGSGRVAGDQDERAGRPPERSPHLKEAAQTATGTHFGRNWHVCDRLLQARLASFRGGARRRRSPPTARVRPVAAAPRERCLHDRGVPSRRSSSGAGADVDLLASRHGQEAAGARSARRGRAGGARGEGPRVGRAGEGPDPPRPALDGGVGRRDARGGARPAPRGPWLPRPRVVRPGTRRRSLALGPQAAREAGRAAPT